MPKTELERLSEITDPAERLPAVCGYMDRAEDALNRARAARNATIRTLHGDGMSRRAIADLVPDGKLTVATVKSVTPR